MAVIQIDTRLDAYGNNPLGSPEEIESLISRVDVLLTTRLHGLVLALKNGVPPVAIDTVPRGGKVSRQAEVLGWPASFLVESLDDRTLQEAFRYCLTDASRAKACECRDRAHTLLNDMRDEFNSELRGGDSIEASYQKRLATLREDELASHSTAPRSLLSALRLKIRTYRARLKDQMNDP
jgi:hypothetical protein